MEHFQALEPGILELISSSETTQIVYMEIISGSEQIQPNITEKVTIQIQQNNKINEEKIH